MLRNKYRAFEIKDNQVSQTLVDGNLCSIAEFIQHCDEGSIITLHTMEGEPFLIGLSKMFVFCGDKAFLDRQLIPYLRSMGDDASLIAMQDKFRQMAELESGDIVKLSVSSGKIMVSKVDIVEMGSQDPQAVEAYVNAAVKHMSPAKQVALAARILKFAQQEGGTDC